MQYKYHDLHFHKPRRRQIAAMKRDLFKTWTGLAAAMLVLGIALGMLCGVVALASEAPAGGRTMYVHTETDLLNVRDEPSLSGRREFGLYRGEAVEVYREKRGWLYLNWCGQWGWAREEYLKSYPPDKPDGFFDVEED